jgi:uncharacterized protein YkwD
MLRRMQAPPSAGLRPGRAHPFSLAPAASLPAAALLVVVLALLGAGVFLQTAAGGAPQASSGARGIARLYALEPQVFAAINHIRRAHGLAPLRLNLALAVAAGEHSVSMAEHGYFAHSSRDGSPFWKRVAAAYARDGSPWSVGENIVWASPGLSARKALEAWLTSPPHRKTLLSPLWREVGLGAARAFAGGVYQGRVVTILTADFGARG